MFQISTLEVLVWTIGIIVVLTLAYALLRRQRLPLTPDHHKVKLEILEKLEERRRAEEELLRLPEQRDR